MRRKLVLLAAAGFTVWAALDLWAPRRSDLRRFDPKEVARIETDMWRSYYDRKPVALYSQIGELMRTQYRFPWLGSQLAAYHAAKAAFIFKGGGKWVEYERALADLRAFYRAIRKVSDVAFDADRAARRELEWWIVHRQRERYGREALVAALAELQAAIYNEPAALFQEHAAARADAMLLRDGAASRGGVGDRDWAHIHQLLIKSWSSLRQSLAASKSPRGSTLPDLGAEAFQR
jgi:hypothetical protein